MLRLVCVVQRETLRLGRGRDGGTSRLRSAGLVTVIVPRSEEDSTLGENHLTQDKAPLWKFTPGELKARPGGEFLPAGKNILGVFWFWW